MYTGGKTGSADKRERNQQRAKSNGDKWMPFLLESGLLKRTTKGQRSSLRVLDEGGNAKSLDPALIR